MKKVSPWNLMNMVHWLFISLFASLALIHNPYYGIVFHSLTPPRLIMVLTIIIGCLYLWSQRRVERLAWFISSKNCASLVILGFGGLIISLAIAILFSLDWHGTVKELGFWVLIALIFIVACALRLDGALRDEVLLAACIAFVGSYIVSFLLGVILSLSSIKGTDASFVSIPSTLFHYLTREGFLGNADVGAPLLIVGMSVMAALMVHPLVESHVKIIIGTVLACLSLLVPFYEKRTALVALLVALICQLFIWRAQYQSVHVKKGWSLVLAGMLFSFFLLWVSQWESRMLEIASSSTIHSTLARLIIFEGDLWILDNHPFGIGAGAKNFLPVFGSTPYMQRLQSVDPYAASFSDLNPHSLVLSIAVSSGWMGFLFFGVIAFSVLFVLYRAMRHSDDVVLMPAFFVAATSFFAVACVSFVHSEWPWLVILLGLLWSLPQTYNRPHLVSLPLKAAAVQN